MPYLLAYTAEMYCQGDDVPRTFSFDFGKGPRTFVAQVTISALWFGSGTPTPLKGGKGILVECVDIDGVKEGTYPGTPGTVVGDVGPGIIWATAQRFTYRVRMKPVDSAAVVGFLIYIQ